MVPSPYTRLLADYLQTLICFPNMHILDIGCGSGALALVIGKQAEKQKQSASLVLADYCPRALIDAQHNVHRNWSSCSTSYRILSPGHMFESARDLLKFDLIVCNPASLPLPPEAKEKQSYYAGPDGRMMIETLLKEGPTLLAPGGVLIFAHTSLADLEKTRSFCRANFLQMEIVAQKQLPFREFYNASWIQQLDPQGRLYRKDSMGRLWENVYVLRISRTLRSCL